MILAIENQNVRLLNPINDIFRNAFIDKHMKYVTIIYFLQQKKE